MIDEQTEKRRGSFWRELPILLGVAILVAVLVRAFVLQTFYIPSQSMEHTLNIKTACWSTSSSTTSATRTAARSSSSRRPIDWRNGPSEEDFIKRVIGVGGDHVVCCDDQQRHHRSTARRSTSRTSTPTPTARRTRPADEQFDVTVPDGPAVGDGRPPRRRPATRCEHYQRPRQTSEAGTIPRTSWSAGRSWSSGRSTGRLAHRAGRRSTRCRTPASEVTPVVVAR